MIPVYAAVITYVGVVAPHRMPFIIAGFCGFSFSLLVTWEYFGVLSRRPLIYHSPLPPEKQLMILIIILGLLFVVAFIASYTACLLKKNRDRLRNKNVELEKAVTKAKESDRIKSEFLANMSHELRTPLNHIIGFTELVVDGNFGDLTDIQSEYLKDVLQSSRHLLSLINDVLDLSKIEAGKIEYKPVDVHIKSLLGNSLVLIKEKALKHGITLSMDMDGIPETIRADERRLKQIMYNLLSNAAKFTPDGGEVRVSARLISAIQEGKEARHLEVIVSDTGIGIRRQDLDRIFDTFEQVEGSTSRKYHGTGLGLSLTRSLVEMHGGRIWAESEGEGKGSTFRFFIPVFLG
ncbi:MAG: hypothetical protein JRJ85_12225 [Deltaproteobacteria bacterium]|nr:hypothetical protein [Deltaproteobacteria bacterium]